MTTNPLWRRLPVSLLEMILGGLFVYAGIQKQFQAAEFAEAVLAYRLLPETLVGAVAAVLPWLEVAAGLFLVVGLKKRSSLLLLTLMAAGFMGVLIITAARGLDIDCGCGLFWQRQVGPAAILEDGLFLAWAAGLYYWEWTKVDLRD